MLLRMAKLLCKIGTKMIPGLVTKINYSVDVNTGEKKSAYTLKKNEIASCTLEFSEKIVVDEFDRHRTLGELILIDRVTNMTSACGVVRKPLFLRIDPRSEKWTSRFVQD